MISIPASDDVDSCELDGHEAPTALIPTNSNSNSETRVREPTLTVAPLAVIMFYSTSGGPFGVEGPCAQVGAFYVPAISI